jgi:hypothetical protein
MCSCAWSVSSRWSASRLRSPMSCGSPLRRLPLPGLSVAGRRAGLAGERSGLFHEFARIADALRPRWLLVENVPGLLSSNGGRDFGVVLGTLADLGYGVAWRILDSRFFGVPQRRRRVFIVGALADGDPRAAAERAGEVLAVGSRCDRHLRRAEKRRPDGTASGAARTAPPPPPNAKTARRQAGWSSGIGCVPGRGVRSGGGCVGCVPGGLGFLSGSTRAARELWSWIGTASVPSTA